MGRCVLRPLPRRGHLPTRPIAAGFFGPAGGSAKPARSGRIGIARVYPILSFALYPIGVAAAAETQGARADSYARFPNRGRRQILSVLFHAPVIGHPPAISKRPMPLVSDYRRYCKNPAFQLISGLSDLSGVLPVVRFVGVVRVMRVMRKIS